MKNTRAERIKLLEKAIRNSILEEVEESANRHHPNKWDEVLVALCRSVVNGLEIRHESENNGKVMSKEFVDFEVKFSKEIVKNYTDALCSGISEYQWLIGLMHSAIACITLCGPEGLDSDKGGL